MRVRFRHAIDTAAAAIATRLSSPTAISRSGRKHTMVTISYFYNAGRFSVPEVIRLCTMERRFHARRFSVEMTIRRRAR